MEIETYKIVKKYKRLLILHDFYCDNYIAMDHMRINLFTITYHGRQENIALEYAVV